MTSTRPTRDRSRLQSGGTSTLNSGYNSSGGGGGGSALGGGGNVLNEHERHKRSFAMPVQTW